MALHSPIRIDDLRAFAPAPTKVETDGESWSTSVRQVIEAEPAAMRALGITQRHLDGIRFDEGTGQIIIPIGRRNDNAVRTIMHALHDTTDIGEGSGEHELRGFSFVADR